MDDQNQPLRELFDKIDAKELAAMKDRREEESFNLDFKRMDPSGEPDEADKKNLREAISGFANSAGGILLWGVDSKSGADRRDRSRFQGLVPVKDGDRAAVRFHELTATATQPPVSGVVHKAIAVESGFVVKTFVPASDGGPHRTNELNGQYFRRDADAFRAMQHHEIADMFGRRARPRLELWWERIPDSHKASDMREIQFAFLLGLKNTGRGIARFPCLALTWDNAAPSFNQFGLGVSMDRTGLPRKPATVVPNLAKEVFAGGSGDAIHPGQLLQVTRVGMYRAHTGEKNVEFEIFAEGAEPVKGAFRVSSSGAFILGPFIFEIE